MGLELEADLDDVERSNHEAGDKAGDGAGEDDLLAGALVVISIYGSGLQLLYRALGKEWVYVPHL